MVGSSKVIIPSYIGEQFQRPSAEDVMIIGKADVTSVSELVGAMYSMDASIRAIAPTPVPVCGVAITAKCPPGDNQAMIRALNEVQPGDVLVVDAMGFVHWCLGGYLLLEHAKKASGLAGLVVNGAYRDVKEIAEAGFPVYARGVSPCSGPKNGPGEVNVPVACGGVVVQPGDVLTASAEGIVVVPRRATAIVAAALTERQLAGPADIDSFVRDIASAFDQNRSRDGNRFVTIRA